MRIFLNLVSACIILIAIYIAYLNMHNLTDVYVLSYTYNLPVCRIIAASFAFGILSALIFAAGFTIPLTNKLKEYKKKLEKTSIQSTEDISKIEVLEAKIETLEKALNTALNKNKNS